MQVDYQTKLDSFLERIKNKFHAEHVNVFVEQIVDYDKEFEQLIMNQIPNYDEDNEDHIDLWNEKCHELADIITDAIKRWIKRMCESASFFFIEKSRSSKNAIHLFFVLFQTQIFFLIGQKQFGE